MSREQSPDGRTEPKRKSARGLGWMRCAIAFCAGLLLLGAFPPFALWPLPWISLAPLYVVLADEKRLSTVFRIAWFFGITLFLVDAYWMLELGTVPWAMLAFIEAIPFGLQAIFCALVLPRLRSEYRPAVFATVWVTGEWLRSCGRLAFPWFLLATSQVRAPLPILQILSVTGQWGLSFAIAFAGASVGEAFLRGRRRDRQTCLVRQHLLAAVVTPVLLFAGGVVAIAGKASSSDHVTVAAIQGNIRKQDIKSDSYYEYRTVTMGVYSELTREAANGVDKPDLIVWPETVVPGYLYEDPEIRQWASDLARTTDTALIAGTVDNDPKDETAAWNTAVFFDAQGVIEDRYDKIQVVPIGEYFPLRGLLGSIYKKYGVGDRDFVSGTRPGLFRLQAASATEPVRIGALICYDDVFTWQARDRVRKGAQLLVLTTSDQTFGTTSGPQQHADLDVLRSVESGRYLFRAAATGPSELVSPIGKVESVLPIDQRGILRRQIPLLEGQTLFVRFGDWFVWVCVALSALAGARAILTPRSKTATSGATE